VTAGLLPRKQHPEGPEQLHSARAPSHLARVPAPHQQREVWLPALHGEQLAVLTALGGVGAQVASVLGRLSCPQLDFIALLNRRHGTGIYVMPSSISVQACTRLKRFTTWPSCMRCNASSTRPRTSSSSPPPARCRCRQLQGSAP